MVSTFLSMLENTYWDKSTGRDGIQRKLRNIKQGHMSPKCCSERLQILELMKSFILLEMDQPDVLLEIRWLSFFGIIFNAFHLSNFRRWTVQLKAIYNLNYHETSFFPKTC